MKRFLKGLALLAAPSAVNYLIFKFSEKRVKSPYKEQSYGWRHGNINYVVRGKGEPVLLLHDIDNGFSLREWHSHINLLSRKYKVYAFDFIGFGHSDKPQMSYTAYLFVILINDFIKNVIKAKTNVIASGKSAAYTVLAYDFSPELFKRLLLVSPAGINAKRDLPVNKHVWARWLYESPVIGTTLFNLFSSKSCFRRFLKGNLNGNAVKAEDFYYSAHYGGVFSKMAFAANRSKFLNVSIEHILPSVQIPLHIVWGDRNNINSMKNYNTIFKLNKNAKLTIFEGANQYAHLERPIEFCNLCKQYIV